MPQTYKNSFLALIIVFVLVVCAVWFLNDAGKATYQNVKEKVVEAPLETAHLSFVGDIMLDRAVKGKVNKLGGGDYHFVFEKAAFLQEPDLMFANLEGPVSSRGANVGSIYSFRFDPIVFAVLKNAGFDVLSMANNHIGDWGRLALEDTITLGRQNGFEMVGGGFGYEEARTPKIFDVKGIKVGYVAFSDFGPPSVLLDGTSSSTRAGVLSADDPNLPFIISDAAREVDILVASFHFGDEYKPLSNERQKRLARLAIESGADIVAGHHPHVEQEVEKYKEGLIAYSLGNFVFDQYFSKETMRGMKLDVMVTKKGIESYSTSTILINENYQPYMVE